MSKVEINTIYTLDQVRIKKAFFDADGIFSQGKKASLCWTVVFLILSVLCFVFGNTEIRSIGCVFLLMLCLFLWALIEDTWDKRQLSKKNYQIYDSVCTSKGHEESDGDVSTPGVYYLMMDRDIKIYVGFMDIIYHAVDVGDRF